MTGNNSEIFIEIVSFLFVVVSFSLCGGQTDAVETERTDKNTIFAGTVRWIYLQKSIVAQHYICCSWIMPEGQVNGFWLQWLKKNRKLWQDTFFYKRKERERVKRNEYIRKRGEWCQRGVGRGEVLDPSFWHQFPH